MSQTWPTFTGEKRPDGTLLWTGRLKPQAQTYSVAAFWKPGCMGLPYVMVLDPPLTPRPGRRFEEIPHLIFDRKNPGHSGLCLFDPEGNEWTEADLIADNTIHWAAEWLHYYELWHLTGDWLAPGVGYESIAQMDAAEARTIRELAADVH